jgi:flagella basal body P-ring formation protein FlgA
MIWGFVVASVMHATACHPIAAQHIYARDLAAAAPVFAALPPDLEVGFAPMPGQTRVFHPAELRHLTAEHQITAEFPGDICFDWQMEVPAREAIVQAINRALAGRGAQVDLVEQSRASAPVGELVFPLTGLTGVSDQAVVWRGYVQYANDQHYQIWARVRVRVKEDHVVPTEALKPDLIISSDELSLEHYEGPPPREKVVIDLASAVGMVARRPLPPGVPLTENDIEKPRDVERGDMVLVIAEQGRARIETQGVAEEGGRRGATVTVRNLASGKRFRARVEEKDKVLAIPGTSSGLAVEENRP